MLKRNPDSGKFKLPDGYVDHGWYPKNEQIISCLKEKHKRREFDNSLYLNRCTDVVTICDYCKYVYHIDMSD